MTGATIRRPRGDGGDWRARRTSLLDQSAAADADAGRLVGESAAAAAAAGDPVMPSMPTLPFHGRLLAMMRQSMTSAGALGHPRTCPHLAGMHLHPRPAVWLAVSPLCWRCPECADAEVRRREADGTMAACALCGGRDDLHHGAFRLPPSTVLDRDDGPPAIMAGVVVAWVGCSACILAGD